MKISAPLSKSQYGLYVDCASHLGEARYNLPYIYVLDGSLDGERLCASVVAAFKSHPTMFTRIELGDDGEPLQTIDLEKEDLKVNIREIKDIEQEKLNLVKPFNLYGDRLFHIDVMHDGAHYYLFIDYHHIIVDGTSMQLLLHDIERVYCSQEIPGEGITMAQIALDEVERRKLPEFEEAKRWYATNFDCGDTFTQLMPDLDEPESSEVSLLRTMQVDLKRVEDFCKENGIFKSNFFTAAYSLLLAKYNNEQESLFTTVYNGRSDKRMSHTVGMMVKTLPVYGKFTDETTTLDFLRALQEQMTGCREHSIYSYSDLMTDMNLQTNSMFAWHAHLFGDQQWAGKPMKTVRLGNSTLEASLYLKAFILDGKCQVKAEYNSNEYSREIIAQLLESYDAVLEGLLTQELVKDINITTASQIEVLDSFNQGDVPYDDSQSIVSLFNKQVATTPESVAVVYKDHCYTYSQVDDISNRIAAAIAAMGLGKEDVVSVLIPRCEWMAIASMGVLKAGCAYQPLDPSYPTERLNFMMKDASAKLLIVDPELRSLVNEYEGDVLLTTDINALPSAPAPSVTIEPDDLFIMLYTSGSTGIPKGCQLTHANLVAFCNWYHRYYELKPEYRVAAYASYGFDACMMDMYPALTCGAAVHIIPEEIRLDLIALNDYFEKNNITHSFMTTQVGYQFATSIENHSLLHLSTGGEKLASLTPPAGYKFHNVYGPTVLNSTGFLWEPRESCGWQDLK